jgi:hypothetical protein
MYSSDTTDAELEAIKDELAEADMLCLGGDSFVDTRLLVSRSGSRDHYSHLPDGCCMLP